MANGRPRRKSRSRSPRPPRGSERHRSPPRGPRNNTKQDRRERRSSRSRSRSPPRGPRGDRARDTVRQRSPPRGPRVAQRSSNDDQDRHERRDHDRRDARQSTLKPARDDRARGKAPPAKQPEMSIMDIDPEQDEDEAVRAHMRKLMGFGTFRTTKNSKVPGNDKLYAVRKEKKTEYRQYMNRQGGFNRPLSPS